MKKSTGILFFILFVSGFAWSQKYVPFPTENAEWNISYCTAPLGFQDAESCEIKNYSLGSDSIINNLKYKKLLLNHSGIIGFLREENKKIYYIGSGFTNYGASYSPQMLEKIKTCSPSFTKSNENEYLLYDFNAKEGDDIAWGQEYNHIDKIDSVLIGNSYRKRFTFRNNSDVIIEGIGSVVKGLLSYVSPIADCSDYMTWWNSICFSQNGQTMYQNPAYVNCNSTEKWTEKKFYAQGDRWTEYIILNSCWDSYTRVDDKIQYNLEKDTLLGAKVYHKMTKYTPNNLQQLITYVGGMREENGKVYIKYDNNDEFLLYDFTVKAGDTIHSTAPGGPLMQLTVVYKVDTVQLLNGEKRKLFHCNYFSYIEGIGSPEGFFAPLEYMCTCCPYYTTSLACFKTPWEELYKDTYWCADGNCCGVLVGIQEAKAEIVRSSIHPNPANDIVTLEFATGTERCTSVEIMDFQGRQINTLPVSGNNVMTIDVSNYHAGIYFILVRYAKGCESHKLIKL
ncbi:MAG: T9SS type A sorting domain-containing protein [Paludibacter sp.]|nr:T9SS type A sorting domain-containing protein [Paludibacter sp.]